MLFRHARTKTPGGRDKRSDSANNSYEGLVDHYRRNPNSLKVDLRRFELS